MYFALWLTVMSGVPNAAVRVKAPHTTFAASKLDGVKLQSAGGGIKVRGIRTDTVGVELKQTLGGSSCSLTSQITDATLVLTVSEANSAPCQIDLDISLPRRMDVNIRNDAGNVFVSGVEGSLMLYLNQGNAVLGGKIKSLKTELGHGSLSAQGLLGDADVTLTAGNAQLWYMGAPKATVSMAVESGNVTVGSNVAAVDTQVDMRAGQLQSSISQKADAPLHLKGHISHGNLVVRAGRSP